MLHLVMSLAQARNRWDRMAQGFPVGGPQAAAALAAARQAAAIYSPPPVLGLPLPTEEGVPGVPVVVSESNGGVLRPVADFVNDAASFFKHSISVFT